MPGLSVSSGVRETVFLDRQSLVFVGPRDRSVDELTDLESQQVDLACARPLIATERSQPPPEDGPRASGEPDGQQCHGKAGERERKPAQVDVLHRWIRCEAGRSRQGGGTGYYTRTTRAWRLNALTSSTIASSGTPSRHSTIGTPSDAYRDRSASRRRRQSR